MPESLIPDHGGYRNLASFRVARLTYDVSVRFCDAFVNRYSRTHGQIVQAARSGVQNIAEGSKAAATSRKSELLLTNVARASLEELALDYEDFLSQRKLSQWPFNDPRRLALIEERGHTADDVALWVREQVKEAGPSGHTGPPEQIAEYAANAALTLTSVAITLLKRQLHRLAADFESEGGFSERLHRVRCHHRKTNRDKQAAPRLQNIQRVQPLQWLQQGHCA